MVSVNFICHKRININTFSAVHVLTLHSNSKICGTVDAETLKILIESHNIGTFKLDNDLKGTLDWIISQECRLSIGECQRKESSDAQHQ